MVSKKSFFSRGFTLIEMLVIVPVVILVIGIFISVIVSMTGDILAARGSNALSNNIQDALNRIEQDVNSSSGYLATNNITLTSPQGYDNDTASFDNVGTNGTMLILNSYATTGNPLSSNQSTIYTPSPNPCNSTQINQNPPVMVNIIYFVKNGTLWRRVVAPYNYATIGCSVPWQQPSCTPGYATPSFCKTQDTRLVDNIQTNGFNVSYFINAGSVSANATASDSSQPDSTRQTALQAANTIGVTINATGTIAGRNVSQSGTLRAVSPNNTVQPIATNGLVMNLDVGNPASYPGNGTTWTDISGNGNNAVLSSGVTYSNTNGGALTFDGVNGWASVLNSSSLNLVNGVTIAAWINPTSGGGTWYGILSKGNAQSYALTFNSTDTHLHFETPASNAINSPVGVAPFNTWSYVVATFNGSTKNIYVNGVLTVSGTLAANLTVNNEALRIGQGNDGELFKGKITNVSVYNRALSVAEIQQNFNALSSRYNYQFIKTLVVGGGGGGGSYVGGGGGGGGFLENNIGVTSGSYTITVGAGGSGGDPGRIDNETNGGNSSIVGNGYNLVAIGGGIGKRYSDQSGSTGGSGGGAGGCQSGGGLGGLSLQSLSLTGGYGYRGGNMLTARTTGDTEGRGGGGAGGQGLDSSCWEPGDGGPGRASSITGTTYYYGGGGGGGAYYGGDQGAARSGNGGIGGGGGGGAFATGTPGTGGTGGTTNGETPTLNMGSLGQGVGGAGGVNTGGGGGGCGHSDHGGSGGSGIVIISYPTGYISATGGTITTSGGYTIHKFTSSGTFIVN